MKDAQLDKALETYKTYIAQDIGNVTPGGLLSALELYFYDPVFKKFLIHHIMNRLEESWVSELGHADSTKMTEAEFANLFR